MNTPGGVSLLITIFILIGRLFKGAPRTLVQKTPTRDVRSRGISFVIIGIISVLSLLFYGSIVAYALDDDDNNLAVLNSFFHPCVSFGRAEPTSRSVVLRLDDVQAFGWSDISTRMMQDALNKQMPVVAGVIPIHIHSDKTVATFLTKNECNIEIAMHGYLHGKGEYEHAQGGEFADLSYEETKATYARAKTELSEVSDGKVLTFIPPNNKIGTEAKRALKDEGIQVISSEGKELFDYDIATWDASTSSFVGADAVMARCKQHYALGDSLCVIELHPQDFAHDDTSLNQERYSEYEKLLEYLETNEISVVTFDQFASE